MVKGNRLELLKNGDEIFPAMLEAIRHATRNICFETYVYWSGDIATEFATALSDRARAGVDVRVLIDWYGSRRMSQALIEQMEDSGVAVERFRPLKWSNLRRFNHRTHRKLLITDGEAAFTGGVGIAEEWTGDAQDPDHWRDNHYRISGPIVAEIHRCFYENWQRCGHSSEQADGNFPRPEPSGHMDAAVVAASPDDGPLSINTLFFEVIDSARRSLDLATAYFVPGKELVAKLVESAGRGVQIRLLVCGKHIDETLVRYASKACWGELLEAGIRIYEYQPTLYHVKAATVDAEWLTVGSANIDLRSCRLNHELNLVVHDEEFARRHVELFNHDCARSNEVTFERWRNRPLGQKLLERLAQIFRSQL